MKNLFTAAILEEMGSNQLSLDCENYLSNMHKSQIMWNQKFIYGNPIAKYHSTIDFYPGISKTNLPKLADQLKIDQNDFGVNYNHLLNKYSR